jgi:hypothetical protein
VSDEENKTDDQGIEVVLDESTDQDADDQDVVDAEGDDTKAETDADSQEEDSEKPAETETEDEGEEDALEEAEWLKQFEGMPDSIKTVDGLADAYLAALPEMKRAQTGSQQLQQLDAALKARGLAGGVNSLLAGDIPQFDQKPDAAPAPPPKGQTYFDYTPVKGMVDQMIEDGRIQDSEESPKNIASHKHLAQLMDGGIGPQLQRAEEVYTVAMRQIEALTGKVRNLEWGSLDKGIRGSVDRAEIDALLNKGLFNTYEEAIRFHAFNKPDLLTQLTSKAQEEGKQLARKNLKRSKALRRGKPAPKSRTYNYDRYIKADGEWDQNAMATLTVDERIEMLEAYQKERGQ